MSSLIKLETMHKIFKASVGKLIKSLPNTLLRFYSAESITTHHNKASSFIYVKGTDPYMLVAHLDTVHKALCTEIKYNFYKEKDNIITALSSPQGIGGDDRCGVILILSLLKSTNFRPSILFTCGEEIGGLGAKEFTRIIKDIDVNFILEFDRRGDTDVVRYSDTSMELTKALESFGFKLSYGSFSDISIIAPHYGVSAVNLSSGYYKAHTTEEYVVVEHMESILDKTIKFLKSDKVSVKYTYKERTFDYRSYHSYYDVVSRNRDNYSTTSFVPKNQMRLFDDSEMCDFCGDFVDKDTLIDTSDGSVICPACAEHLKSAANYISCPHCGNLIHSDDAEKGFCFFCGGVLEDKYN